MAYEPMRYPKTPWCGVEQADLRRAGKPETHIQCGRRVDILGLHVKGQADMLGVKLVDGVPVSAALTTAMSIDTDDGMQSNPRRAQGDGDDGA
jgi:hypothetical protein